MCNVSRWQIQDNIKTGKDEKAFENPFEGIGIVVHSFHSLFFAAQYVGGGGQGMEV